MPDLITAYDVARYEADMKARREQEAAATTAEIERLRKSWNPPATYTRAEIAALYAAHRRGDYKGREIEWSWVEQSIMRASKTGRIVGGIDPHGRCAGGPTP
jgi:regulator of protease activity HflC (stomatin/prohibitin superfamily)